MSIVQVAKLAGVTHGTVSRFINGRDGVSKGTAQRIRQAMSELDYQPKPLGKRRGKIARPAGLRTRNVCLLLVGAGYEILGMAGFSKVLTAMESELRQRGLALTLGQTDSLADLPPCIEKRKVDGLFLVGEAGSGVPAAAYRSLPAIWLLSSYTQPHGWADHILPDNERIGTMAAEYLASRGHRRVAFYNDQPEHPGFVVREAAFAAAARGLGLESQSFLAEKSGRSSLWGLFDSNNVSEKLVERLLGATPRVQGVFVPNDDQILRFYPLLAQRSIVPGRDLDILSCNNQETWLRHLNPPLPSIDLNFELIGRRAVEQLISRINHPEQPLGTRILVPPKPILTEAVPLSIE